MTADTSQCALLLTTLQTVYETKVMLRLLCGH